MTNEELIKGLVCIKANIEVHKDLEPIQTETFVKVIDEVIEKLEKE